MKQFFAILLCLTLSISVSGQNFWKKEDQNQFTRSVEQINERKSIPSKFDIYSLSLGPFSDFLKNSNGAFIIELPNGKGKLERFRVQSTPNLAPELAAKYPMIHSYTGYGIDDPTALAKIDIGTKGFHAIIFSGSHSTVFIDPYTKDGTSSMVYYRKELDPNGRNFNCEFDNDNSLTAKTMGPLAMKNADDGLLRSYRIAIATTGEYSQYHLNQQGIDPEATDTEKKAAILSAMNTTMNRVNGVYEKDLGVRMIIVADNDQIIFLDAASDGLSNNNASSLINQSQTVCDNIIGSANYDIGHTFSTGGGGLAGLGVVCVTGSKARGITGQGNPINDPFDIDYVAHEIGHQFGANHTQNNSCNRNSATAVEPGSASTIMGYAGICAPNVQNNSDDHFHAISIQEMWNRIQSSATCSVNTNTNNSAPSADAGPDVSIPRSTPFVLRGIATDADGISSLTYNWEQIDNEIGSMPPSTTNSQGPMFRSLPSKTVPDRYMPALATVIAGNTSSTWEVVPSVARNMEFAFTVRDNNSGGGNSARDDKLVTTIDVTPFTISSQSSSESYSVGSTQTVTWNVGSTNVAPINCQNVNIKLSVDGGLTFPIELASNTPNDGSQDVVIPNNVTTAARVLVEAADNIFYNVNAADFNIESSEPTFVATNTTGPQNACNDAGESVNFVISMDFISGFSENVSFSATGLPSVAQIDFSPNPINFSGDVIATVSNLTEAAEQVYNINVTATSTSVTRNIELPLTIYSDSFSVLNLTSPSNGDTVTLTPMLTWDGDNNANSYDLELATDNAFSNIIISENVTSNSYTVPSPLTSNATFYWRVKPKNLCGEGAFSSIGNFETGCDFCESVGNLNWDTAVTRVVFNTIDNASDDVPEKVDGYQDFTSISTLVQRGDSHDLTVNVETDGAYTIHAKAWIDWNQNCTFDVEEEYDLGTAFDTNDGATNASPFSVIVPTDAVFGSTRMRVSARYNTDPEACTTGYDGQIEDYTIVVDNPASVNENSLSNFSMFPNPSKGFLTLRFDVEQSNDVEIQMYDIRGRKVKDFSFNNTDIRFSEVLDITGISSGVYLVKVLNGNKSMIKKLIIE